jgi:hypothetical protein
MYVRLLAGYAADAIIRAAAVAEMAFKIIAGKPSQSKATLGELIDRSRNPSQGPGRSARAAASRPGLPRPR